MKTKNLSLITRLKTHGSRTFSQVVVSSENSHRSSSENVNDCTRNRCDFPRNTRMSNGNRWRSRATIPSKSSSKSRRSYQHLAHWQMQMIMPATYWFKMRMMTWSTLKISMMTRTTLLNQVFLLSWWRRKMSKSQLRKVAAHRKIIQPDAVKVR